METLKNFVILFLMVAVSLVIVASLNFIAASYENVIEPIVISAINNSNITSIMNNTVNLTEYDLYRKVRPHYSILDLVFAMAVFAAVAGVFAYTRQRT